MSRKLPTTGRVTNTVPKAKQGMSITHYAKKAVPRPKYPKPLTIQDWLDLGLYVKNDVPVLANNKNGEPVYFFCQVETWEDRYARLVQRVNAAQAAAR